MTTTSARTEVPRSTRNTEQSATTGCTCAWCERRHPEDRLPAPGMCHFPTGGSPCHIPPPLDAKGVRHVLFCGQKPDGSAATHDAKRAADVFRRRREQQDTTHDPRDREPWTQAATTLHLKLELLPDVLRGRASDIAAFVDEVSALTALVADVRLYETELQVVRRQADSDRILRDTAELIAASAEETAGYALQQQHEERAARLAAEAARAVAQATLVEFQVARDAAMAALADETERCAAVVTQVQQQAHQKVAEAEAAVTLADERANAALQAAKEANSARAGAEDRCQAALAEAERSRQVADTASAEAAELRHLVEKAQGEAAQAQAAQQEAERDRDAHAREADRLVSAAERAAELAAQVTASARQDRDAQLRAAELLVEAARDQARRADEASHVAVARAEAAERRELELKERLRAHEDATAPPTSRRVEARRGAARPNGAGTP